jgi:hypothetical protein
VCVVAASPGCRGVGAPAAIGQLESHAVCRAAFAAPCLMGQGFVRPGRPAQSGVMCSPSQRWAAWWLIGTGGGETASVASRVCRHSALQLPIRIRSYPTPGLCLLSLPVRAEPQELFRERCDGRAGRYSCWAHGLRAVRRPALPIRDESRRWSIHRLARLCIPACLR